MGEVLGEDLGEDFEALQLGKLGEVEAVEKNYQIEGAPTSATAECHGTHGTVVHAEELADQRGLYGFEVVRMARKVIDEGCGLEVEVGAGLPVIDIRHETQESREVEEKDDVEVGIARLGLVEPTETGDDEFEEGGVLLFGTQGMKKKIGEEETDGRLQRTEREFAPGLPEGELLRLLEIGLRMGFPNHLHQGQRLPRARTDTTLR